MGRSLRILAVSFLLVLGSCGDSGNAGMEQGALTCDGTDNQLLSPTGGEDRETDLDGVIDRLDEFPLDPTRQ